MFPTDVGALTHGAHTVLQTASRLQFTRATNRSNTQQLLRLLNVYPQATIEYADVSNGQAAFQDLHFANMIPAAEAGRTSVACKKRDTNTITR